VNAARISITGKGNGGVLALYAAVLEPRVTKVTCAGSPESYMGIVRQKMHEDVMDIVVPGVLRDFDLPDLVKALGPRCVIQ
jgi:hypothetical protein